MTTFNNKSKNVFEDISSEEYRIYRFSSGEVKIEKPTHLSVAPSGGHRVFDESGLSHYIPKGWIQLTWKAREGQPHFVK